MKFSDLKSHEIIDINSGRRFGYINDISLNLANGTIEALIVSREGGFRTMFSNDSEVVIPWDKVKKVGIECIIVDLGEGKKQI